MLSVDLILRNSTVILASKALHTFEKAAFLSFHLVCSYLLVVPKNKIFLVRNNVNIHDYFYNHA